MKKRTCFMALLMVSMLFLPACSPLDVIKDILSVNQADTSSDEGPKVTITKPTPAPKVSDTVTPAPSAAPTPTEEPREMVYCISPVNVRDAATNQSQVIGALTTGDAVEKLGEERSWIKIKYEGREAWVYEKYMSSEKPEQTIG